MEIFRIVGLSEKALRRVRYYKEDLFPLIIVIQKKNLTSNLAIR
jgi:hypothetical protein